MFPPKPVRISRALICIGCVLSAAWGADTAALRVVNAANYASQIAPGAAAAAFSAADLPTDSSTSVEVCQPGTPPVNCAQATVYGAYPTQINFLVPASTPVGPLPTSVLIQVLHAGTVVASGTVAVTAYSPGIFTANATGKGIFAGQTYDRNQYANTFTTGPNVVLPSGALVPSIVPKPVLPDTGTLILYGTGWHGVPLNNVRVMIDGVSVTPEFAGQVEPGLDQINIHVPSKLVGPASHLANVMVNITHASGSAAGVFTTNTVQFCIGGQDGSATCPVPEPMPAPVCTDPIPGLTAPYAPHGIFVLQFPDASLAPVPDYILKAPAVCGGNIFIVWSQVDSGNGNYDWSGVDSQIAPWVTAGKSVNLIVWGVNQQIPNTATPDYVQHDKNYQSVSCNNATYPVYYSPGYKENYKKFIQAVMDKYGSDPNVGYIRFGLARGGEAFPTCMTEMMQMMAGQMGPENFNGVWEGYIHEMTSFANTLGHAVQLMGALNQYGNPPQYSVTDFEAANATSLGFGFGSQGLSLQDFENYPNGPPCASNWCANFMAFANHALPLELQPVAATDPTNAPGGTGSLVNLLPFGLSLHAQIFELYVHDLQVAYDTNNPSEYSQEYQAALQQAAAVVGGRP